MGVEGDGSGGGRLKGKAKQLDEGPSVDAAVLLPHSDSLGSTANPGVKDKESGMLKTVARDLLSERRDPRVLQEALSRLQQVFPHVCRHAAAADLSSQLSRTSPGTAFERIKTRYLERGVPKAEVVAQEKPKPDLPQVAEHPTNVRGKGIVHGAGAGTDDHVEERVDVGAEVLPPEIRAAYDLWSLYTLSVEFPRLHSKEVERVFHENDNRLTPSYKALRSIYAAALAAEHAGQVRTRGGPSCHPALGVPSWSSRSRLVKPGEPCRPFETEWLNIRNPAGEAANGSMKGGRLQSGTDVSAHEGEEPAGIECGCCCSDSVRIEEMAQCADGHLFCFTCLRRRVEESTYGGARAGTDLPCMDTSGCGEFFPWSEVKRALPPDVLARYEQRQAQDAVTQANIHGLVYCPFCGTPYEMSPDLKVLECENGSCKKASCVECREPSHIPLRCEEVEKRSETALRRNVEERMSKALLRACTACKAELLKSDGCNKVTCRCGQAMCYVCRQPVVGGYRHFCQHARLGPKKTCTECERCSLWEEEEEHEVVGAAREAAMKELARDDPDILKRTIGPELEKVPRKKHRPPPIPAVPFRPPPPEYYNRRAQAMVSVAERMQLL
ncbi:hypothetical protein M758_8G000600 [Ceratodon purpureus]|uniref:RING-type domain-containing protein n=1 Tax=Ceratodon purpureus TaxID=3225 RepID=A0A8T0H1R9_CERPU|nr:hypothetical protein KC19_8G000300 [Ceratodon purpureus]KAG0563052.1 hypothetical protein KC19_8G001000 [Ceratodon purpureus]KAG0607067.1 hypothetical protein M758_8G000600 [Ceratodon purpureus]